MQLQSTEEMFIFTKRLEMQIEIERHIELIFYKVWLD
jgi:hypothetical protein